MFAQILMIVLYISGNLSLLIDENVLYRRDTCEIEECYSTRDLHMYLFIQNIVSTCFY